MHMFRETLTFLCDDISFSLAAFRFVNFSIIFSLCVFVYRLGLIERTWSTQCMKCKGLVYFYSRHRSVHKTNCACCPITTPLALLTTSCFAAWRRYLQAKQHMVPIVHWPRLVRRKFVWRKHRFLRGDKSVFIRELSSFTPTKHFDFRNCVHRSKSFFRCTFLCCL